MLPGLFFPVPPDLSLTLKSNNKFTYKILIPTLTKEKTGEHPIKAMPGILFLSLDLIHLWG